MDTTKSPDPTIVSAAHWFWWIAGLSLVNTVLIVADADISFAVGLGITIIAAVMFAGNLMALIVATAISLGVYFFLGLKAQQARAWAFYVGLVIYALDAVIFIIFQDWMSVAFHGLAIFYIAKGVMRVHELAKTPAARAG